MTSMKFRRRALIAFCVAGALTAGVAMAQATPPVAQSDTPPADTAQVEAAQAPANAAGQATTQEQATGQAGVAQTDGAKKEPFHRRCLQYTGSRIKAYDSTTGKRPCIAGPGSSYSKDDIDSTGQVDLGRALKQIDPAIKSN